MGRTTRKPTTRKTIPLAQGCYQDAHGITILARIGTKKLGTLRSARDRFPLVDAHGNPYTKRNNADLVFRYAQLMEDLRSGRIGGDVGAPGTLAYAIDRFLEKHPVTPGDDSQKNADYKYLLAHWKQSALAPLPVVAIRRRMIADVLDAWTDEGRAPSTVNSRKRALGDVLRVELEAEQMKRRATGQDDDVVVPTDLIQDVPPKDLEARGIDMEILTLILAAMPDRGRANKGDTRSRVSETKIRCTVMAWTGLPHKSLMRLPRHFVRFDKELIQLPARKKGKGAAAVWVEALPQALDALRQYDKAGLWLKKFSRSSMHKAWTGAVERTRARLQADAERPDATDAAKALYEHFQASVPAKCRPYDARHSFMTEVLKRTGDRTAAKTLGNLKTEKMLDRYTKGAVSTRVSAAMSTLRAHWAPDAKPTAPPIRLVPKG